MCECVCATDRECDPVGFSAASVDDAGRLLTDELPVLLGHTQKGTRAHTQTRNNKPIKLLQLHPYCWFVCLLTALTGSVVS